MEFKARKSDLVKELALMQGIVERRTTLPILANFLVNAEKDTLSFLSTDLELTLRNNCPGEVKEAGTAALPTRIVYDVVRTLPEADILFQSAKEAGRIELSCGSTHYRIPSLPAEEFPQVKDVQKFPVTIRAGLLQKVLNHILFAISGEESRFPVTGALFMFQPDSMNFVSTDGHRLCLVEVNEKVKGLKGSVKTIVPRKALVELKKIVDLEETEDVSFAVDENQAFFRVGSRKLITRLLEAEFPRYEKVIPQGNDKVFLFERQGIEQAVRNVAAISSDKAQGVKLDFSAGKVVISSSSADLGEAKDELSTAYDGKAFEIGFNIQYLLDFFTHCSDARVTLELKDQSAAGLLRPDGEEGYRFTYVLMPMKI